jgi:hypothetical protein
VTVDDGLLYYESLAGFVGSDTFEYTVTDLDGDASAAEVFVEVQAVISQQPPPDVAPDSGEVGVNDLPEAVADSIVTTSGDVYVIDVLENDLGLADGVAEIRVSAPPVSGASVTVDDGLLYYESLAGFVGSDTFEYTVTDLDGDASAAEVFVEVQEVISQPPPPDAAQDSGEVGVNGSGSGSGSGSALRPITVLALIMLALLRLWARYESKEYPNSSISSR